MVFDPQFRRQGVLLLLITLAFLPRVQAASFLFDATKAEMAGSADWVIDADLHNLTVNSASVGSGSTTGSGNESNPQRYPTPDQSTVTASTPETYWDGALSAWAIDLVKNGHHVETLPYNGRITWKDSTNPQDLTNYNVFVMVEPNILFTATEKTAIISFVKSGGGLFIVSDHGVSDRNNDGADSVQVLNDLMTNSVQNYPFGIHYNGDNISPNTYNVDTNATDPVTRGPAGVVTNFYYNNGSSITVNTNQNPSTTIAIWNVGTTRATNNAIFVYGTFGAGKFATTGDSSPFDDGTGDPNDSLFYSQGYADPSTSNGRVILNASLWLAQSLVATNPPPPPLKIAHSGTNAFQIAWSFSTTNYTLQGSTNFASWYIITNGIQTTGTNSVFTNSFSGQKQFFRLMQ
ncbi:MAG TPA: hypothetical protein VG347_03340 [Verrucomicrobiae bacterium]|nr:hypothetical protein [Verrucomicrobiae bacterium]